MFTTVIFVLSSKTKNEKNSSTYSIERAAAPSKPKIGKAILYISNHFYNKVKKL